MIDIYLEKFTVEKYQELFLLTNKNHDYLKQTLPWLDTIKTANDTKAYLLSAVFSDEEKTTLHYFIMDNNKIIGVINLREITQHSELVGYWIDKNYQGKNITTTALKLMIEIVKKNQLTNKLKLRAGTTNIGSNKVAIKCGFILKETLLNSANLYGNMIDLNIYELDML